jgi:hypothetical protein
MKILICVALLFGLPCGSLSLADDLTAKVAALPKMPSPATNDWLIQRVSNAAGVFSTHQPGELVIDNGLIRRSFLVSPNLACIEFQSLSTNESMLRSIRPECRVTIDGELFDVGGLLGQPIDNFLKPEWYAKLSNNSDSFQLINFSVAPIKARFAWKPRPQWISSEVNWPPKGTEVQFQFQAPVAPPESKRSIANGVRIVVHYEIYEGIPLLCKWFTLHNESGHTIRLNRFTSEILACVEASSQVEDLAEPFLPNIHVETNFTTCSMNGASAQVDAVHWIADPTYKTQVNYLLQSKCLLECRPPQGPDVDIAQNEAFESFRTWILAYDNREETRSSLALGRMYRTIAPWALENPLIHHVRSANPAAVRLAIDQAADVGFEMVIMTFGSGFDMENSSSEYLKRIRELADYAHSKGIALGGYSLLASRSVSKNDDVVNPKTGQPGGFARFGNSPCLESEWGQAYFAKLEKFFAETGCDVLEHDGSYPGDACASTNHPGHRGYEDSRWRQWERVNRFYQSCRAKGIYLNVPDWYFLNGSSKIAMGYRETNWSLPREYQEIIERQNIHDGTRYKLPTMGWMFVPLTEYHGGGPAATIEPLSEHLDHYERRLQNLLGAGVQACFRGPRLYDTNETKVMVKRWVDFYKSHRAILDSSLIPLRRADGRDWDGWIHVNPELDTPAFAMLYNPMEESISREIVFPLRYSGITGKVQCNIEESEIRVLELDRNDSVRISLSIPAKSTTWVSFSK